MKKLVLILLSVSLASCVLPAKKIQEVSNAEKQQHYDKNIELYHEYSAKFTSRTYGDSLFSPSYYRYFDEQLELSQALHKQVELY